MKKPTCACGVILALLVLSLGGCGGDSHSPQDPAPSNPPPPNPPAPDAFPVDPPPLAEGSLYMEGIQESTFNPTHAILKFGIKAASFSVASGEVKVLINNSEVDSQKLQVTATQITAAVVLSEGRNDILFKAYDNAERPVFLTKTVWAGANKLAVNLVDSNGAAVTERVKVKLSLGDDSRVMSTVTTSSGNVVFVNVPGRTVVVETQTEDNRLGIAGGNGAAGTIAIPLLGFDKVDLTDNNDFIQGLAGYVYSPERVVLVPHVEQVGPSAGVAKLPVASALRPARPAAEASASGVQRYLSSVVTQTGSDERDAQLTTFDQGPQTMSRTFRAKPGTSSVAVRYRFVSSEVPAGFFGSEFNDYFSVTLRNSRGESISENNTVNGLGPVAFDGNGSTAWKTLSLATDTAGGEIAVSFKLGNAGDGAYDSQLIVDAITEKIDEVLPALSWDPVEGGLKLAYTVGRQPLSQPVSVDLYWASGLDFGTRIGLPIATIVIPSGTPAGAPGARNIPGSALFNDPAGVTHIIASANGATVARVADVEVVYGPNASAAAVSAEMNDIIKDAFRATGTPRGVISRTAMSPADQARAMFQSLVRLPGPLSANISEQRAIYTAAGDAVISVFANSTAGSTVSQAISNAASITAAMEKEIRTQGPGNVAVHCADPARVAVVDVSFSNFTAGGKAVFKTAVGNRAKLAEENDAFHLELPRQQ